MYRSHNEAVSHCYLDYREYYNVVTQDKVEALNLAKNISWNTGNPEYQRDDLISDINDELRKTARDTPFIVDEYSAVVVRSETRNHFDVFLVDEDKLFLDARLGVLGQDIDKIFRLMGFRQALFTENALINTRVFVNGEWKNGILDKSAQDSIVIHFMNEAIQAQTETHILRQSVTQEGALTAVF